MYIYKVRTVVWNSPVHSVCVLDNGVHYLYTDVPLECVNFFSFQIYNRVINFPLQCINSWEFLMYEVSVSHISTNFSCQNKLFYKNLYGFHAEGIYEWRGGGQSSKSQMNHHTQFYLSDPLCLGYCIWRINFCWFGVMPLLTFIVDY